MHNDNIILRNASSSDIDGIIEVTIETLLANQSETSNLCKYGFLINSLSSDEIENSILDKNDSIVIVAEKNNKIIGFTLGCNCKKLDVVWGKNLKIEDETLFILEKKNVYFLNYIARLRNEKGCGRHLLKQLIHVAKLKHYDYIICEIAQKPIMNNTSIKFHEHFGYKNVGHIKKVGFTFGVNLLKI